MNSKIEPGPLKLAVQAVDLQLKRISDIFLIFANACLGLMLVGTAATILLRLINISFYLAVDNAILCLDVLYRVLCCLP